MSRSIRNTVVCTAIMVVGAIIVALVVSALWPSGEFPQSQTSTTVAPTTAEPAVTAPPTTSAIAELPEPSPDSRQIVNLNDLAVSLQSELTAIPADQTALRAQKLAEYTKVRGLKSDAELAAVTKPRFVMTWFNWVMLVGMFMMVAFVIIMTVYSIRYQKRMETLQREALGLGESIDSIPATSSQPEAAKPARQDLADFLSDDTTEETTGMPEWHTKFDRFYHAQTPEVQAWMWAQRQSWPKGQEASRWAQLKARLLEAAAS